MDKYRVTLTAEERADLEQLVSTGKAAARKLTHARILLLADDSRGGGGADAQIVAALGTSLRPIAPVRQHLVTQGLDAALLRRRARPRPAGRAPRGGGEGKLQGGRGDAPRGLGWRGPPKGPPPRTPAAAARGGGGSGFGGRGHPGGGGAGGKKTDPHRGVAPPWCI